MSQTIRVSTFKDKLDSIKLILKDHMGLLMGYLGIMSVISLVSAITPYITKLQLDQLQNTNGTMFAVPLSVPHFFLALLIVPALLELLRIYVFDRIYQWLNLSLEHHYRVYGQRLIWQKLMTLDAGFFHSQRNKDLLQHLSRSVTVFRDTIYYIGTQFSSLVSFAAIIPIMAFVDWRLMVLILVTAIVQFLINEHIRNRSKILSLYEQKRNEREWRVSYLLDRFFYDLKTNGTIDHYIAEYEQAISNNNKTQFLKDEDSLPLRMMSIISDNILVILANFYVGYQVLEGNLSIGTFTLVVSYTAQISGFFRSLLHTYSDWQEINLYFDQLNFFLSLKSRLKLEEPSLALPLDKESVSLKDVSFSYPDHFEEERAYLKYMFKRLEKVAAMPQKSYLEFEVRRIKEILEEKHEKTEALHDVSVQVPKGKITVLVGRNGSGKSTITHLLQHHYEADTGKILLGEQAINKYSMKDVLSMFSWLRQEPFILDGFSIKENLLLGSEGQPEIETKMLELSERLGINSYVSKLPKKYDSVIGEDVSLSGGQLQLIAVGRSLLQKRPFIIFDEASSQLDIEKEFNVMKILHEYKADCAILFITHRITVARKADYIYVIDQGTVAEEGTHAQLLNQSGLYKKYWEMQTLE